MPREFDVVVRKLKSTRFDTFRAAIRSAVTMGTEGDRLISEAALMPGWRGLYAIAALGESRGPYGERVLEDLITRRGAGTSDARCASLLALAKRSGVAASGVLADAVNDGDSSVREYAVACLATAGDGRAWDSTFSLLDAVISRSRKRRGEPSLVIFATAYLARHGVGDPNRLARLAGTLQRNWGVLHPAEHAWLETYWPSIHPQLGNQQSLLSPSSVDAMHEDIMRDPLFSESALI